MVLAHGRQGAHREQGGNGRQRHAELIGKHGDEDAHLAVPNDNIDEITHLVALKRPPPSLPASTSPTKNA